MTKPLAALLLVLTLANTSLAEEWTVTAGDVLAVAVPLTALTATFTLDDPEGRAALFASYTITMTTSYALKANAARERPDGTDELSFPSAHTASAFSGAAFLQRRYGWEVGLPAYLSATYTGWSRLDANRSHVSDIVAGAALAWGINYWLVPKSDRSQFALMPTDGGMALAFEIRY